MLLRQESVWKSIDDHVALGDIDQRPDALWSLLLFSGYLKAASQRMVDKRLECELRIPNLEVEYLYEDIILGWLQRANSAADYQKMIQSLLDVDIPSYSERFRRIIFTAFSYMDTGGDEPEFIYHAFTLGLLISLKDTYEVKSNSESGFGRYDVVLIPKDTRNRGFVFEFKKAGNDSQEALMVTAQAALKQVEEKAYATELQERGIHDIIKLGIAFRGKETLVLATT